MNHSTDQLPALSDLKLVLLDRDGVINLDSKDYIKSPGEWQPLQGAIEAIVKLQDHVTVAVCTNQSGVGRGLFSDADLADIHNKLNTYIESAGGTPVDVFYCPHLPDAGCHCRKPEPELLSFAMRTFDARQENTLYAGDSEKDLLAAHNAGCIAALVLTGNGSRTLLSQAGQRAGIVYDDLAGLSAALLAT